MSNSVFQSVIVQLRDISDRVFGVIDTEGCVISCTDMTMLGERWADAALRVGNASDSIVTFAQKSFKAIMGSSNYFEYAVFCSGDDETARSFWRWRANRICRPDARRRSICWWFWPAWLAEFGSSWYNT